MHAKILKVFQSQINVAADTMCLMVKVSYVFLGCYACLHHWTPGCQYN